MIRKIHLRADTIANWANYNPTLNQGEIIGVSNPTTNPIPGLYEPKYTNVKIAYSDNQYSNIPFAVPTSSLADLSSLLLPITDSRPSIQMTRGSIGYFIDGNTVEYTPTIEPSVEVLKDIVNGVNYFQSNFDYTKNNTKLKNRLELVSFLSWEINTNHFKFFSKRDGGTVPGTNLQFDPARVYVEHQGTLYSNTLRLEMTSLWTKTIQYNCTVANGGKLTKVSAKGLDKNNQIYFFTLQFNLNVMEWDNDVYNVENSQERFSFSKFFEDLYNYTLSQNFVNDINNSQFKIDPKGADPISSFVFYIQNELELDGTYYYFFKWLSLYEYSYFCTFDLTFNDANKTVTLNPMKITR